MYDLKGLLLVMEQLCCMRSYKPIWHLKSQPRLGLEGLLAT